MPSRLCIKDSFDSLLRPELERAIEETILRAEDREIARMYLLEKKTHAEIAVEIYRDRSTVTRRIPGIIERIAKTVERLDFRNFTQDAPRMHQPRTGFHPGCGAFWYHGVRGGDPMFRYYNPNSESKLRRKSGRRLHGEGLEQSPWDSLGGSIRHVGFQPGDSDILLGGSMMYNYGPYGYPTYPNYQDNLSQLKQPQASPIIWVQGEPAARAYMVAAGNTVLLMDSDASTFYLKSTDASGMPQPLRTFDYEERGSQPVQPVEYATKDELKALEGKLDALMGGSEK